MHERWIERVRARARGRSGATCSGNQSSRGGTEGWFGGEDGPAKRARSVREGDAVGSRWQWGDALCGREASGRGRPRHGPSAGSEGRRAGPSGSGPGEGTAGVGRCGERAGPMREKDGLGCWGSLSFEFSFYFLFFSNFNSISFLILTKYN